MKTITGWALVLGATVYVAASTAAQTPVGALEIDEGQSDLYGWAADYETASAVRAPLGDAAPATGGADPQGLRGLRSGPVGGQHGRGLGRVWRVGRSRP